MKSKCCGASVFMSMNTEKSEYWICYRCALRCEVVAETQDEGWRESFEKEFGGYLNTSSQIIRNRFETFIASEIFQAESQAASRYKEELRGRMPEEKEIRKLTTNEQTWYHTAGFNACRSQVLALLSVDEVNGKEI